MLMLVTGGAGFIGSHIVDEALRQGVGVRVLDSLRPGRARRRRSARTAGRCRADRGRRARRVDRPQSAGRGRRPSPGREQAGWGCSLADAADYTDSNVTGTAVLLTAMAEAGVSRLVLASSMVVYGEGRYEGPDGPIRPLGVGRGRIQHAGWFEPVDAAGRAVMTSPR